jgi:subtilisin family serine protease
MRKIYFVLLAFLLSCGSNNTATLNNATKGAAVSTAKSSPEVTLRSILSTAETGNYREGELLVKFRSGVIAASSMRTHQSVGAARIRRFSMINAEHVKLPAGLTVQDAITHYMQDPNVEYAEPNYIRSIRSFTPSPVIPNDLLFGQQWALRNTGSGGGTAGADIDATNAWDITTGSHDIVIAVIDSGIDYNHPDLAGNIWSNPGETNCTNGLDNDGNGFINDCRGWNFVDNNNAPLDDLGHGTHVAGIIGATGNNGTGVAGVMWHVQLMPLKFLDSQGNGTIADEVAAMDYAVMMKNNEGINIKAMNASFAGSDFSNIELSAISTANDAGILLMAAAGNGNRRGIGVNNDVHPQYPASYSLPNIIAVAATDSNDNLASFSDFGLNTVHVAAPGVNILSTVVPGLPFPDCIESSVSGYDFCDGTSFSTPFISGLAGLLATTYPDFNHFQIRGTILRYVDVLPSLQGRILTGGRINSFKAVSSLLAPTDLTTSSNSSSGVSLTWTDNATGEDGYNVERETGSGPFTVLATLGPDSTSFTDTTASTGTTYTYRVTAFNSIPANSAGAEVTVTAGSGGGGVTTTGSRGGGGCTIGARQNTVNAAANTAVLFLPLLVLVVAKNIRRRKK